MPDAAIIALSSCRDIHHCDWVANFLLATRIIKHLDISPIGWNYVAAPGTLDA